MHDATEQLDVVALQEAPAAAAPAPVNLLAPAIAAPAAGSAASTPGAAERVIAGYRLFERIGEGGYGEVWRAEAPGGMPKAVKIVHGRFDERRAVEELKSLQRIKDARHPFLLSLERIEIADGQLIVVTELADESLRQRYDRCVESGSPGIPRDDLLRMLAEAADALDYMSSRHGLAHLDIKPENILLVGDYVKVADFGLVKDVHRGTQSIMGGLTPLFAAPETFDGRPGDRSDQYSLAVVYQFALTGKLPFTGKTTAQLAAQHTTARPDTSSLPEADRALIERALAKDPFDRFESCRALIDHLAAARGVVAVPESGPSDAGGGTFRTDVLQSGPHTELDGATNGVGESRKSPAEIVDLPTLTLEQIASARPALVIGLGGCGAKTLRAITERLRDDSGDGELPSWFHALIIDTDYDEFVANFVDVESSAIAEHQFIHLPLKPTQYYRKHAGELTRWLSRRWIYNIPKSQTTDGIRPLGRLALVDHMPQVERRIDEAVDELLQSDAPDENAPASPARVFLVGSLTGGTGGAIYADVAQVVHRAFVRLDQTMPEIIGVLAHWTSAAAEDAELSAVNACAALGELHHYKSSGCPGDVTCHLPALGRQHGLFKHTYYLDLGWHSSRSDFEEAADTLASYVAMNLVGETADFGAACRREASSDPQHQGQMRTFELAALDPRDLVEVEGDAKLLAAQALDRLWLADPQDDQAQRELLTNVGKIVAQAGVAPATLTAHIQELNEQRVQNLLAKANACPADQLQTELDAWRAAIDQQFPAQPKAHKPSDANNDPMQEAIAKLLQQSASTLHRLVAEHVEAAAAPPPQARSLLAQLVDHLENLKSRDEQCADIVVASNTDDADPLTQITGYLALAQRRNTAGWLDQIAELLQSSLRGPLDRAGRFVAGANELAQQWNPNNLRYDEEVGTGDCDLVENLAEQVDALAHEHYGDAAQMLLRQDVDWQLIATETLAAARQTVMHDRLSHLTKALRPPALRYGGARHVLIAAPQEIIDAGLLGDVMSQLSQPPTIIAHDSPQVLLWCEGEQIKLPDVVASLVGHRPELRELASQLRVRNDVAWATL